MRVLIVVEQLRRRAPGGIGTYARGLLQGLGRIGAGPAGPLGDASGVASGVEVTLLASRPARGADPLASYGLPVVSSHLPGALLTRAWDTGLLGAPDGYDVVHAVSLAVPRSSGPAVATVHDLAWRQVPDAFPPRGRRWHEAALERALRRTRLLLAPSAATAEALRDAGAPPDRVAVFDEGADHLPPADDAATRDLLDRLGVESPYLLSVGTNEPRKNLQRLCDAYDRARSRLPGPWPMVVVGPHGWGGALRPHAGVVLAGEVSESVLAGLYQRCRCLAYVPLHEGFGLPAVEAMAAGAPVVASPMPSTQGAALEVDPLDVEGIADGLVRAAVDGSQREDLVAEGRRRVDKLTWESAARRHVELWEQLR
ncbi:MAG TPA: glycosyltransferase family 1 protein [Acidimicrobiales bacterium]|nr:glycosyltransferase family 1 protein [Acidimicrobiales bacterium]